MATRKSKGEPSVRHIQSVLDEFHEGLLLIPRFQRRLVWDMEMRRMLLDSIREEIPIGSFMVWRTSRTDIRVKEALGPFQLPQPDLSETSRQYLLDGEQRLSTLYFSLFQAEPLPPRQAEGADPPDAYRAFFDLIEEKFLFENELKDRPKHWYLSLWDLLEGNRLAKFQRDLLARYKESAGKVSLDTLLERSDALANRFRQYQLPVMTLATNEMSFVARTFVRVNQQHARMNEMDLINAKAQLGDLDIHDILYRIRSESLRPFGWDRLDEQTILRVFKAVLGLPVFSENPDEISEELQRLPAIGDEFAERLGETARFFHDVCMMRGPEMVPSAIQIVLTAAALKPGAKRSDEVYQRLKDWIWLSTMLEFFKRQPTEPQFDKHLGEVLSIVEGKRLSAESKAALPAWRPMSNIDTRQARWKLMRLLLAEQKPWDASNKKSASDAIDCLVMYESGAVSVIPDVRPERSKSIGARFLVRPESAKALFGALRSGDMSESQYKSHVINAEARQALSDGDMDEFVLQRESALNAMEKDRYEAILERLYAPPRPDSRPRFLFRKPVNPNPPQKSLAFRTPAAKKPTIR